jgi:replicative DNA helicase
MQTDLQQNFFEKVIPSITTEQERVLSYILQNPEEYDIIDKKYFESDVVISTLHNFVSELIESNTPVDKGILVSKCRQLDPTFKEDGLDHYYSTPEKKEIVEAYIQVIKDNYNKRQILQDISKLVSGVAGKKELDYDKLQQLSETLLNAETSISDLLLDLNDLSDMYKDVFEKRKAGTQRRSLGFNNIDTLLARPGAAGEMTGIVGAKGSGKSLLSKCIENSLVNQRVCVVSINLEMEAESNYDRLLCIRENLELKHLLYPQENDEAINNRIEKGIKRLKDKQNYLYYTESQITLAELDKILYVAKKEFKKRGCLPEDEYMLIAIDLADMIDDFSNAEGAYGIKKAANKLHQLTRKHKCHTMYLVQANENKFRGGKTFTTPEACDSYRVQVEDVEGGATYAARSRVMLSINRPNLLKKRFLHERREEWDLENDIMYVTVVKQNDGKLGECQFVFPDETFRIIPYSKDKNIQQENTNNSEPIRRRR